MTISAQSVHIAVVDDDATLRELFVRYLESPERRIWAAESGASLDKVLAEQPVDVVVLERHLPDADGLTMVPRLKRDYPQLKLVLLSARSDPSWINPNAGLDASACLIKPTDLPSLECTVARLVAQVRSASLQQQH